MTNLRKIRTDRNCTTRTLSEITGININIINKWDSGDSPIDGARLINGLNIARALGVAPEELLENFDRLIV